MDDLNKQVHNVAFVACEECKFTVEFSHDNKTFVYCKKDKIGANLSSDDLNKKFHCNRCWSILEIYNLSEEDNVCPICNSYLSVCYGKNEIEREKARSMFLSDLQRAQSSTGRANVIQFKLVNKKGNKQESHKNYISSDEIESPLKAGLMDNSQKFSVSKLNKIRKKHLLIFASVLLISLFFYWFSYRPGSIRQSCANEVRSKYGNYSVIAQNNRYRLCLVQHGLKPESLFVNLSD